MNGYPVKDFSPDKGSFKTKKSKQKRFDALLKRAMEDFTKEMIRALLGLELISIEFKEREFPRIQVSGRRVDFLAKVRYRLGLAVEKTELLHIEIQTTNDLTMPQRMLRYGLDIYEREKEFPSQVVIYIGRELLKMRDGFTEKTSFSFLDYSFRIIDVSKISADVFLRSEKPDVIILGILGNYDDAEALLTRILQRLSSYYGSGSSEELRISISKLEIVCQLRGLTKILYKKVNEMLGVDFTELESYKEGMEKGIIELGLSLLKKRFNLSKKDLSLLEKQLLDISEISLLQKVIQDMLEQDNYEKALKTLQKQIKEK